MVWPYHHATEDPGSSCLTAHSQPYKTKCLLCIPGRKKEERQGTKRLHLLGLWLLFGKGRSPLRTFFCSSSAKLVSYGQALLPWWLGILVLHGLASLVQGSIWLGMGRVNRSLVPKRPSSYPTCLFQNAFTYNFEMHYMDIVFLLSGIKTAFMHAISFAITYKNHHQWHVVSHYWG